MCTYRTEEGKKKKPSSWIQRHVSLILLDNGELNNSTFDPWLCEVHYYLFRIIIHFKSPAMKKHVKTLKEHLVPSPKALWSISLETFLLRLCIGCEWARGWVSVLPLFKVVYLTYISMETRPTSKLTVGMSRRGMKRKIQIAKMFVWSKKGQARQGKRRSIEPLCRTDDFK